MQITRLKRGYRISLTDAEYEMLEHLANLGVGDVSSDEGQLDVVSDAAKAAYGYFVHISGPLPIDDDRRT